MVIDISKITLQNLSDYTNNKIRKCPICGKEFKITRKDRTSCSSRCTSRMSYRTRKEGKYDDN